MDTASVVMLSLKVALVAVLFATPIAVVVAWWLAQTSSLARELVNALVHLPLVLPPVVTGYGLLVLFGRSGPVGSLLDALFGFTLAFRWTGAALAAGVMAFPLMVRPIRLAFEAIDPGLEPAASTLGAGRLMIFFTIALPLALPGLIAGVILGFAKALGEFGATITFVSNIPGETRTLSLAIYSFLQSPSGDETAIRLILISLAISLSAILASEWIARRNLEKRAGRR